MKINRIIYFTFLLLHVNTMVSHAQGSWFNTGIIAGTSTYAMTEYNGSIVTGGAFSTPEIIFAMAVYNGKLYTGGANQSGITHLYENGSSIASLSNGGNISCLQVINNELYVGGFFSSIGGVTTTNIAKYNGTSWTAMGNGLGVFDNVNAFCNYNGVLYAATSSNFCYKWNGSSWILAGAFSSPSGLAEIKSLCIYFGEMYAGGFFSEVNGMPAVNIAKYNGVSWNAIGDVGVSGDPGQRISALATYDSKLYCGGAFATAGGISASNIAMVNATGNWQGCGSGTNGPVRALLSLNGSLYAAGNFTLAGGINVWNIARWTSCVATITPIGNQNFCTGNGILLQANTGAGLTYQWKKNGTNVTGATNSTYTVNSTGLFTVVVANATGCSTTSNSVYVTGPPSNTVSALGLTHFCTGGNVTLKSVSGQTVTYQWRKNGANISGATSQTYVATSTGSYNCIVTNSFGCSKGGTAIAVTGPPSAVITANGPTTFCTGGSVLLSAAAGYTYQWIKNSVNISGATSQNYSAASAGNYKVKVTDPFGCSKTTPNTNQITVSVPCREGNFSTIKNINDEIKIFPNPSSGIFTLDFPGSIHENIFLKVRDLAGKEIMPATLVSSENTSFKIDLSNQAAGMYLLQVQNPDRNNFYKLIKE